MADLGPGANTGAVTHPQGAPPSEPLHSEQDSTPELVPLPSFFEAKTTVSLCSKFQATGITFEFGLKLNGNGSLKSDDEVQGNALGMPISHPIHVQNAFNTLLYVIRAG